MEMESVIKYFENKTILVTGANGFLGKILVEKILRIQPNIKKLFLLIRASNPNSTLHRLHSEVIGKDLYRVIKEIHGTNIHTFISEKVTPVAGDVYLENLGVTNIDLLNEMRRHVDFVISSAATTKFDERYDVAFATNTLGVKLVSSFVNECSNIKLLLHVSTAYVSCEKSGIIFKTPLKMGETLNGKNDLNIKEEKKIIVERHKQLIIEKANEDANSSAMKSFGIQRTVDSIIAAYGRGKTSTFLGDPSKVLDLIPADMVINVMLVAIVVHLNKPYSRTVYHVGSSMSNPLKISNLLDYICDCFAKHPLINGQGNPIKTTQKVMTLSSMSSFNRYMVIRYMIPFKVVEYANKILFGAMNAWYSKIHREIKFIFRFAELYKPYGLINMIFDDANLNNLLCISKERFKDEMETFFFDTKSIDWEGYFTDIHIPGLVKHELCTHK